MMVFSDTTDTTIEHCGNTSADSTKVGTLTVAYACQR